ncbi:MAG: hypothetical protein WBN94_01490 [Methanothrix sp.]
MSRDCELLAIFQVAILCTVCISNCSGELQSRAKCRPYWAKELDI